MQTAVSGQVSGRDSSEINRLLKLQQRQTSDLHRTMGRLACGVVYPFTLLECTLMAAVSVLAYWFWRLAYALRGSRPLQRPQRMVKRRLDPGEALGVMQVVERVGAESGARVFWLSGTLLGLERLGRPLPHDTDMDAGIDIGDAGYAAFIRAMWMSPSVVAMAPQYISLKDRIQNPDLQVVRGGIIRYKAVVRNELAPGAPAIKTDLFVHFPYCGGSMHGSRNSLWWNSPFSVEQRSYEGGRFSVPGNAHRHLTENYGDYRTEVTEFENSIDCPNAMNIYSWTSILYLLVRQYVMIRMGRLDRAGRVNARIAATLRKGAMPWRMPKPGVQAGS